MSRLPWTRNPGTHATVIAAASTSLSSASATGENFRVASVRDLERREGREGPVLVAFPITTAPGDAPKFAWQVSPRMTPGPTRRSDAPTQGQPASSADLRERTPMCVTVERQTPAQQSTYWHDDSMANHTFYSDRMNGPQTPLDDTLPATTSRGLLSLVQVKITGNWFAQAFPERCPDGHGICDTDIGALSANLQALVPMAPWPLLQPHITMTDEAVFDLVEFAAARIKEPVERTYHSFFGHYELDFSEEGRAEFLADINTILQRGRTPYEMRDNGEIHRRGTPEVEAVVAALNPATGDEHLDRLIIEARSRYTSRRPGDRSVALEKLWDAFERLKTIDKPEGDKKQSVRALLAHLDPGWREDVETEMTAMTNLGNNYQIRHHETRAIPIPENGAADYLFARMGALITLLLTASHRLAAVEGEYPWDQ